MVQTFSKLKHGLAVMLLAAALASAGHAMAIPSGETNQATFWHHGIFRVNSNISAGKESIDTIAAKAKSAGLDFAVVSDQFLVKCEYGVPPLKNLLKVSMERGSVMAFGIENYLGYIRTVQEKTPGILLVPGADIAPHYYWIGSPFRKSLVNCQFSKQMTVFGSGDPEFYRNLPVIHNRRPEHRPLKIFKKLLPLLVLGGLGVLTASSAWRPYYMDGQGNKYYRHRKLKIFAGAALVVCGLLWTADRNPFATETPFDQYSNWDDAPFQAVIDHVGKSGHGKVGIMWSSPEAKNIKNRIAGIRLQTDTYIESVCRTQGHNGFGAIYPDVSHAHEPGKEWDYMLLEYSSGKRSSLPAVTGELDYHGGIDIDKIKTVVWTESPKASCDDIVQAIIKGRSYAVVKRDGEILLEEAQIRSGGRSARIGETLKIAGAGQSSIEFRLSGRIDGMKLGNPAEAETLTLKIVLNGKLITKKEMKSADFDIKEEVKLESAVPTQYLRFEMDGRNSGMLLANPFFINVE